MTEKSFALVLYVISIFNKNFPLVKFLTSKNKGFFNTNPLKIYDVMGENEQFL